MSTRTGLRTTTRTLSGPSICRQITVCSGRALHYRKQSTSSAPQSRFKSYYLLAIPLALLPFTLFGDTSKPLDPYTYSTHKVGSTSKLTTQHARIRIPLSASDSALFHKGQDESIVIEHVMIKNPDLQIERPYTPINDVGRDGEVDVVVKRVQGGEVGKMIHRLTPGGEVGMRGPIPTLSLRPGEYDKIVMISTGTGVAPFLQLLNKLPDSECPSLQLIHSLPRQSDQDIDFVMDDSLLPALFARHRGLTVTRPPAGPIPTSILEDAVSARKEGEKVLVLVCLPQSLMRPLCGGLTIDMKQGPILGTLGQMGLTDAEVYKLE